MKREANLMTKEWNVFLSVSKESKAYRLFNPLTQKIIISRDVVFDEDNNWDWSITSNKSVLVDLDTKDKSNTEEEVQSVGDSLSDVPLN